MIIAEIILGAREWLGGAIALAVVALFMLGWNYVRAARNFRLRAVCLTLKAIAVVLLALCLVDPLYVGARPQPGSNLFLVLADQSRSLELTNPGEVASRGAQMQSRLTERADWLARLGQEFELRKYTFANTLEPVQDYSQLAFEGEASNLQTAITSLTDRYRGQPIAGILVLTDGNATDLTDQAANWSELPPVYPVALARESAAIDLALAQVAVSQTNFEAAPVTISADITTQALAGKKVIVRVLSEDGQEIERQVHAVATAGERLSQRFLVKPEKAGLSFYQVQASLEGEVEYLPGEDASKEATLVNNRRLVAVDRGGGPFRVLYISGMPNWEFKFLRRALSKDDEVDLIGLVRIAKKEPKFNFLARDGERTNPLFRGFGNKDDEQAEQYDEPVLLRLGTEDQDELRGGFPQSAEELFRYHAIILDDIEAEFFTQDQQSLLQQFVSQRGGGLLMMGGKGSFGEGGYARSPIGEMLPVYLDRTSPVAAGATYQLKLTREGWLQPWIRLRANERDEEQRLATMPAFRSLNRIEVIKPGAEVLAEMAATDGATRPALVVQPFGRGRTAALLVGDLWRWDLRREEHTQSDLEKSWRQTVRWLVADVPQPVEVETRRASGAGLATTEIIIRARDKQFKSLDNATVAVTIRTPDDRTLELVAESSESAAGEYRTLFAPRSPGAYRASVSVTAPDGSSVGQRETGWTVEPETEEFKQLAGNQALLERIARESGGQVLTLSELDRFVANVPQKKIPIVETWTYPLWHQGSVLALAIGCLVGEWGLRRWKGLP